MALMNSLSQQEADFKLSIDLSRCEHCRRQHYRLRLMRFVAARANWIPLPGLDTSEQVPSDDAFVSAATSARAPNFGA
jgi:hypothetical protein